MNTSTLQQYVKLPLQEHDNVYGLAEDSLLFVDVLDTLDLEGKTVLEIGCGSGVLSIVAAKKGAKVTAVDVNQDAIALTKENAEQQNAKITTFQSDMFEHIHETFDYIICNTPYLPADKTDVDDGITQAIVGGKHGYEFSVSFIEKVRKCMHAQTKVLLLFSSATKPFTIFEKANEKLLSYKKLGSKHVFAEELQVYEFAQSDMLKKLEAHSITSANYLGKGKRSVVYKGMYKGKDVAVKTQSEKTDAQNVLEKEARYMQLVNKKNIGRKFYDLIDGLLIMEYVDGEFNRDYIEHANKEQLLSAMRQLLEQARTMDEMGLEKQEMGRPFKNVFIRNGQVVLIDFERCREHQKPSNVTQVVQWICSKRFQIICKRNDIDIDCDRLRELSKEYKDDYGHGSYEAIVESL